MVVQTLHEDRIRDAQRYARRRPINEKESVGLFSRISQLLRARSQETNDRRHAHAL